MLWGAASGYVTRLGLDGRPDPTFGAGGFLRAPELRMPGWPGVWGAAWQSDGRLVVLVGQKLLRIR